MQIYIYSLSCPIANEIRYIGISNNPKKRYWQHLYGRDINVKTYKSSWIKGLLSKNLKPILEIIDEITVNNHKEAEWLEQYWIAQCKAWGFKLTNLTEGGIGSFGKPMPESTKQAIIKANKGRIVTEKTRKKQSESKKQYIKEKGKTNNQIIDDKIAFVIVNKLLEGNNPKFIAEELNLKLHIVTAIRDGRTFKHISGGKIKTKHKSKLTENQEKQIIQLIDANKSNKEICFLFDISEPTLTKIRKKYGKYTRKRKI